MAMFEVLTKVVKAEELLCMITFAEFVNLGEVMRTRTPIRWIGKLFSTVTAEVIVSIRCVEHGRWIESSFNAR